ncbi:Titin [Dirofilaria immitis]|nr:Titin [Dirofilaria immitis]
MFSSFHNTSSAVNIGKLAEAKRSASEGAVYPSTIRDGCDALSLRQVINDKVIITESMLNQNGNWTNVKTTESTTHSLKPDKNSNDAITSYSTNREKIYHKNATTIEEVHILESSGRTTKNFAEEHWSSKIKSYVMPQPPKFIQIIKAFRVLATDTLTLVVEVQSDPPAIFEWFYNDKPVQQNRRKFKARHGINITTLTVEGPEQGVYKCTARNPVGISTTYGYVTVNDESTDKSPKFVQQIPNLTLRPGNEAVIDVEVEASPPAKFIWYVNGVQFRDTIGQIEVFYPTANRCIARFPIPQKGEYKVTAENRAGKEHSIGYIDIKKLPPLPSDHMYHHHSLYNDSEYSEIPLLQGKGRASSLSRTVDFYEESSYYERSTSLPRQIDRPYEIRKRKDERQEEQRHREQQYSSLKELVQTEKELPQKMKRRRYSETVQRLMPQTPIFTNKLPTEVTIGSGEDLVLSVGIKAAPRADVKWIINNEDHSTLVVRPPVRYGRYCVVAKNEYGMSNQTTRVHHDEEKQYEEVGESHSLPPEITVLDEWELLDEHQRSSRSTDSFETIKHVETAQVLTKGHQTPIQHHAYTIGQFKESSDTKNTVNYEASTITSQPLLKLVAPVVHEPLQGENVSIVSEASRGSSYTERRYEETTSGVIYETLSPKLDKSILHKSLTDITFAKQRWEKTVHTRNEDIIHRMPSSKLQSRKEIGDDGIIERKVFRIPACHNVEPIPKRPFILKQPKPEIRLKAGEKLVLESKVDSMPASQFKWYQNNFEVRPSPSVIIENSTTNESRATFLKPVSGTYKIVASNIHGSCTSTTHVITEITEEWATESAVSVVKVAPEKQEPKYQLVKRSHIGTRNDLPKSPRIVEGFAPILKIVNNEPLVLRVIADAIPEAEFRWMLNNFEVRTSQTIAIERLGPNVSQITFYSPISGRYEVIATNSLGQDSCSGKIVVDYAEEQQVVPIQRVKKPAVPKIPVFINALPGETHLYSEEQEFRLSVSVSGEQPITFRWFADGSLLSNSVEHQMINDLENSTLVVRKQIGCDVDYAVEVSNAHGAAWSETTVKPPSLSASSVTSATSWENSLIEVNDAQRCFPHYTTVLMDKNLQQHDEFTAHVAISRESSPCEFVWMLNGRDIRTIPGFRVESTFHKSTLYIKSVLLKHSGELSVVASNKYGTVRSAAKINVHPSLEESHEFMSERRTMQTERPPRIVSPLQPSVFRAGESLELRCHVDALPRPEVFWTKDEIRINESVVDKGIITLQHPDGRYELINPKCALEDAGLYQLTARNIHGVTSTSAYIQIESKEEVIETMTETKDEIQVIHRVTLKPRFSEVLSKEYDDKIIVSYKVISETPVMISWYKDGQQLYQSYKYRMQTLNDNTHTFIICSVDRWDEGTYTCCAENEYGRSETGIYIRPSVKIREISEQVLVEENDNEVIGLQDNKYTDTKVKLVEPTISGSQEMYSHTAELRKTEEQYKLLVKVAEIVASKLIAKVIIDEAIHIALRRMNVEVQSSEEEEFEQHPCPPRFETNIECYIVDVGDAVMLRTDISGYPQPCVEWYFGEEKVEQSEQIDVKYVNKQATLRIKKVEKKHEGTYYCHAGNEYGKAILPCNLCVTDVAQESSESVYKMIRPPLIYTLSETETEVSSNVHVTHAAESCDNYFSSIQPETFALGYSCFASTSKVLGDSVIITRESTQEMIEREQEVPEAFIMLNVNVERTPALFKHSVRILQSTDENVIISRHEPRYTRTEEVIQTNNILLIGDQRILQEYQFMVTTTATVIFEKPSQRALHEVICLYDEKAHVSKEKVQAANTIDLQKVEIVNELISAIMATKEKFHEAYAEANVDVIRPDAAFDHFITVVESEDEHLKVHLVAPVLVRNLATFDFHFQRKRESLRAESVYIEHLRRNVSKEATENDIAHTNIKVHKPEEIGEYATTIVDTRKIAPELFAIAAAASKLKLINIFVTFTKKGDMAHQALVIEYENVVEDEAILNVAMLTAPGLRSKQESVWSYEKKYEKAEEIEANVVAVFVEVDAICPNQTIELVASVSLPPSIPGITDAARSSQPLLEPSSVSWSESSSTVPKFIKALETTTAVVGQFHQFKCIVSGTPAPRIRWFVDGDVIRDSEVYQTIYEDGVCILKIRELAIEDEGEYTCEAINDAGRAITKCFLQIITEADVLKYQQQAMFENILYSNGGNNNNNNNDNLASVDNISSLSNTDRIMYRNHAANCNDLIERDGNFRKHHLIVNYEFVRTEPVSAETVVIVTRYTSSKKEFRKNFASEERNFNISVFLPNAAMECASIWALTHCENIELFLMPSFQTMDLVIQKFQSQQLQKADFLLSIRKIMFENVSFAICQPWEEILLVKKPESAFIWDNEYYRRQKVRVEVSIKNSNENGYSQLSKNITMRTDCLGRSLHFYFDNVEADDATSLTSQENSIFQMKESINISEKAKNEQNDEIVRYKDEQEEAQIPVLVQEITKEKEVATDILAGDDLSRQTSKEYSGMSVSDMAAIRQYVDELFDFDQAVPISIPIGINSYKQRDANKLNMTGNQLGKPLDFINEEYLDCSFSRRSEHVEAIENRNSSASIPASKECYKKLDMCSSFNTSNMRLCPYHSTETYSLHFNSIESVDIEAEHSKSHINSEFVNTSTSNTRISSKEPQSAHEFTAEELVSEIECYRNYDRLQKPVVLLREKLTELEETLLKKDLECRKSSKSIPEAQFIFSKSLNEEDLYAKSVQQNSIERKIRGASLCGLRQARIIDKEEIRRMTPLTSNIKEQLQSLECMLEEVEKDGENDMNELTKETKVTVSVYADDKQHEVHNILMQINNEISIIKRCCQRNISKTSIDTAVRLLHKVRNNVSSMIDLISLYRKRTGFFFKTDASVNLYLVKREESELINAIVKLCISSDKLRNQMLKSKNSEISTYEDTVFDNKSKTLQGAKIDNVMRTVVSKPVTEKDDKFILSSFDESQNSSLSLRSLQNLQISFRRPRRISQQRADSLPPISPTRMKKYRSKSCNDNKNLIILCYAFGKENNSLPVLQNMTTSMHKKEKESQLDTSIYDNDRLNPVNIMNLVDIKEPNLLTLEQKSKLNEKAISSEGIIKKKEAFIAVRILGHPK